MHFAVCVIPEGADVTETPLLPAATVSADRLEDVTITDVPLGRWRAMLASDVGAPWGPARTHPFEMARPPQLDLLELGVRAAPGEGILLDFMAPSSCLSEPFAVSAQGVGTVRVEGRSTLDAALAISNALPGYLDITASFCRALLAMAEK